MANPRLTADAAGQVPTLVYAPTDEIYVFCDLFEASENTVVEVQIRTVAVDGEIPNTVFLESRSAVIVKGLFSGPYGVNFGGSSWPLGTYRADFFLDGVYVEGIDFSIR